MNHAIRPVLLCILDGVGLNPDNRGNAVAQAKTPTLNKLFSTTPWTTLVTHGQRVGLPAGQMGNSEVGHLNIGAGRVVEQWLERVSRGLEEAQLETSPTWKDFIKGLDPKGVVHVAGLFSRGGVHSHSEHLQSLLRRLRQRTAARIVLHLFSDGRDVPPGSIVQDLKAIMPLCSSLNIQIGTICGRYYAMDRDKRWDRTELAYRAIIDGVGEKASDAIEAVERQLKAGVTDEFLKPIVLSHQAVSAADRIVFFNFREDRMRQICAALCERDFNQFDRGAAPFSEKTSLCFTDYDPRLKLPVLFHPIEIRNHLGEVIAQAGLKQLRAAETEKYPHVTYFFSGGLEQQLPGEERLLVPSPRDVATYDLKPEMSAEALTEQTIVKLKEGKYSLIVLNFANGDMVGHTGNIPAAIRAVETVDRCLGKLLATLESVGGCAVILADHGNAEQMVDYQSGTPLTSHTTFPVPLFVWGRPEVRALKPGGALSDVAPTCLALLGLAQPSEMTGRSLLER